MPPGNVLRFRAFDKEGTAEFDGAVLLSGTYYYGDNQFNDGGDIDLTLYFVPDRSTAARLPHFKERGAPTAIYLSNAEAFAKSAIPKEKLARLNKKGTQYVSGKIDIWVDRFEAGIECDAPFFNARFQSVAGPPLRVALADLPDIGCCVSLSTCLEDR